LVKAFYWQGWKTVAGVAASLVAISTAVVAIATFRVSSQTLQANTRQQTSDRFVKAIEQLGNETSPDIRLGGIYGLEQLARDSRTDHRAVFDVLTAFVRGQVPAGSGKCTDPTLHLGLPDESPNASPSVDVQAAIDAIAKRNLNNDQKGQVLDLTNTCLVAASLDDLPEISLRGADLRFADLMGADLHLTSFYKANLTGAVLTGANLTGTILIGANLTRARFAKLFEGDRSEAANLTRASLFDANLTGADLSGANLTGADLRAANLSDAHLSGAKLSDIDYDQDTIWPHGFQPPPPRKSHSS
jgi:uncharacterized protein YjbI with pentapeptide repeats